MCRPLDRPVCQHRDNIEREDLPLTELPSITPTPLLRSLGKRGTKSVPFDVTAHGPKVLGALKRERFVSPLVKVICPRGVTVSVPPLGMRHGHPPHEPGKVTILLRPNNEVEMVGIHAVRDKPHSLATEGSASTLKNAA
jgi:hypothetical protein